jgi:glyoxylase-like metal-dependent hydrolase (beta-lactamase superfamily II)
VGEQRYSRREFLGHTSSWAAHLGILSALAPAWARELWAAQERFPVVASEPWARIERISDGIWAVVSTPLQDRTTLCNGGIIAGRSGVLVVEAFGSDAGARWVAEQALRLTGQAPTHVVLTHYHSDHTSGLRGAREASAPTILATPVTRDWTRQNDGAPNDILNRAVPLDTIRPTELDLGGRSVVIVPRRGHTDSDVTIEIADPSVVFCGDLVWNGMFPNYMDATPSRLSQAVRLMRATEASTYVPGHGALADAMALDRYIDLLDDVEAAARRALEKGMTAEEAGAEYRLPAAMANWTRFRDEYFATAIAAWFRELQRP